MKKSASQQNLYNIDQNIGSELNVSNKQTTDCLLQGNKLPEPLIDIFLLQLNYVGLITDEEIKVLVNNALEKI
jgi:hypothetical protein